MDPNPAAAAQPAHEPFREATGRRVRWRWWSWLLLLVAALAGGSVYSFRKSPAELHVYTLAAERLLAGDEIYRPDDAKPFTYPPFMALPFVPLTVFSPEVQKPIFFLVNVGTLWWCIRLLRRLIRRSFDWREGPSLWVLWIAILLVSARHVAACFSNQSHDLLVLLAVLLGAERLSRGSCLGSKLYGGIGFGIGAALKATPGLFLPVLAVGRRPLALLGFALGGLVVTLIPDLLFPRPDGQLHGLAWFDTFVRSQGVGSSASHEGTWQAWNSLNQSLAGTIHRLTHAVPEGLPDGLRRRSPDVCVATPSEETVRWITISLQSLVLGLTLWWARRRVWDSRTAEDRAFAVFGDVSLTVCAMLLLSPMSSKSHFCVLAVPAAFTASTWIHRGFGKTLGWLIVASFVFGTLTTRGLLDKRLGYSFLAAGSVTWATVALFVASGIARSRPAPRSVSA